MNRRLVKVSEEAGEYLRRYLPVMIFLVVLAMLYLQNGFAYERQLRELDVARQELEDRKYTYISLQKELNGVGRRSSVRVRLNEAGSNIHDSSTPIVAIDE